MTNQRNPIRSFALVPLALALAAGCEEERDIEPEPSPEAEQGAAAPVAEGDEPEAEGPRADIPDEAYGKYEIDPVHSSFVFAGKHFDVSYTYGMFSDVKGRFELAEEPSESSIEIEVAADSLFSGDKKRDDDLEGPDFLNVKQFPKITFESTKVTPTEDGFEVAGNLTLRGQTKPATVKMTHVGSGEVPMDDSYRTGFRGDLSIDRHEFGITAMPPVVGSDIELIASIEGIKK
ncbi:MAG: YceI family protein [Myxococcota bacterium]